jgi:hypothetical protein
MGKEGWFILAYLLCGAGSAFAAAWFVWMRPMRASRILIIGALLASLIAGRYIWVEPAFILLAFGIPVIMLLLAWTVSGIEPRGDSGQFGEKRRSKYPTFNLAQLLLFCAVFAMTLAHGQIARVPPYRPTFMMQEFSGIMLPEYVAVLERLEREQADAAQMFERDYRMYFGDAQSSSSPGGKCIELLVFGAQTRSADRSRPALVVDLEQAMLALVQDRSLTVEQHVRSPGSLLAECGLSDGFTIRYRHRHIEGLIQAAARTDQQTAIMYIEERTRRNWLSIDKSHYEPRLPDW